MFKGSMLVFGALLVGVAMAESKKSYIVQMRPVAEKHLLRRSVVSSLEAALIHPDAVIYNYENALHGYAATLTPTQVDALNAQDEVLSVMEDKVLQLQTTRTPAFLGLVKDETLFGRRSLDLDIDINIDVSLENRDVDPDEANMIIGVIDTGAWPENPSYGDNNMPPVPSHWKGSCEEGDGWTAANCNKKLIGNGAFYKGYEAFSLRKFGRPVDWSLEYKSSRDSDGHGTHTSTTIAGSPVANVSFYGDALGTARGMAKDARLAIYKVCWKTGCISSDMIAAIDKAIADGVGVISASLGGTPERITPVSTASFAAMEAGIITVWSAGNDGPGPGTITNNDAWEFTIAASSLDRDFLGTITLGNGQNFTGGTLYSDGSMPDVKTPSASEVLSLIASENAGPNATTALVCLEDSLDPALVAGKVVVCTRGGNGRVAKGAVVKNAGARGMLIINAPESGDEVIGDGHVLPAIQFSATDGATILEYAKSKNATTLMSFEGTVFGRPAPKVVAFSSKGPNTPNPQILKPDITAPGLNILAGWGRHVSPTATDIDPRRVDYNVISGTSMSCPHVGGIAGFLKARRPLWSPAALRSALMTTAYITTKGTSSPIESLATLDAATPFDYGSGHVNPIAALDPGLIYEITTEDYKKSLCALNSTSDFVSAVSRSNYTCDPNQEYSLYDLNYPSFGALYNLSLSTGTYTAKLPRTLTNVGEPGIYTVSTTVSDNDLVKVTVDPEILTFSATGEEKTFVVTVEMSERSTDFYVTSHGRLEWTDGRHIVGSGMGFTWANGTIWTTSNDEE